MALHRLLGLCFALLSISAIAAEPPVTRSGVSTTVNPTTGYHVVNSQTIRTPPNVNISPIRDITPHVSNYGGGLQQTIPTGITINGVKETGTLGARVRATTQTLKGGAKTLLKGNLATVVLTAGIQQLLNGVEYVINEGGTLSKAGIPAYQQLNDCVGCVAQASRRNGGEAFANCSQSIVNGQHCVVGDDTGGNYCSPMYGDTRKLVGFNLYAPTLATCFYSNTLQPPEPTSLPVSPQDIDDVVDNNYVPDPADWQLLAPHFTPDDVEITSAPTLQSPPKTTTIYDANGNPHTVKETNIWHDFDIRDNPSAEPKLDHKQTQEEKTYEDGQLTGTTTTTSTTPAPAGSGGGSQQPPIELEIPTDCDFMPTVCAFIDWFKNDDLPEEPDLSQLIDDRDFEKNYTISFGSAVCPAPIDINIAFINQTVQISYEPACEFVSYAKPFILISAYLFAIYITLGVIRNG